MSLTPGGPVAVGSADLLALLLRQRTAFLGDLFPVRAVRDDRLRRLADLVDAHAEQFAECISADFGTRSRIEIRITETTLLLSEIRRTRQHLARWMRPKRVSTAPAFLPGRSRVMSQPLGVVGIVSPWNYPLLLSLSPLVGVLAAGNRAMIKPSELTPRFAEALQTAVARFFAADEVVVVTGDAEVGKSFVGLPLDHLVFTGSTAVGREVAQAAARNLTPVTLELGGKSPAIVDASCDLEALIDRLAWGKLINAGQTCVAPDYALVPRSRLQEFVQSIGSSMSRLYPTFHGNPDYTSIIDERHWQRLASLLDDARARGARIIDLEPAGAAIAAQRQLAPKLVLDVNDQMRIMHEEIFGPILPIVPYDTLTQALAYVNQRERPLALYWFGSDPAARARVLRGTIAGGVCINDALLHVAQDALPFGGVGKSGHGHYHGEYGFRRFSKEKALFFQSQLSGAGLLRPPYKPHLDRWLRWLRHFT